MIYAIVFVGFCVLLSGRANAEIKGVALIGACLTLAATFVDVIT